MGDTITISVEEYKELLEANAFLIALSNAGVDNWEGYSEALKPYEEESYEDIYGEDNG